MTAGIATDVGVHDRIFSPNRMGASAIPVDLGIEVIFVQPLGAVPDGRPALFAIAPAIGGLTPEGEKTDSSRDDEIAPSLGQKVALAEAPDPAAGHFRVPKVL